MAAQPKRKHSTSRKGKRRAAIRQKFLRRINKKKSEFLKQKAN